MDHIEMCISLETGCHYLWERPRLSSQEAVTGSTMPLNLESSKDSKEEGEIKEPCMLMHPAMHSSVIHARQGIPQHLGLTAEKAIKLGFVMLFPGQLPVLDEDSDEADENSREFTLSASLFQLGPAAPGDNHFMTDDDMPPLTSISSSSESDKESGKESEDDSEKDKDRIPGQGIFQVQVPDRGVGRNKRQEMMASTYLPAGPSPAMAITQLPMLF
ncbi:hypothetical protein ARMGADRAFT_1031523 [Armillaria gallica]|uniref:Uncharacterized protein n=1 Tax=Armillaria gallica TaxID=47427 RepID=A0A2H3DIK0_ARMGA|nr:hypothetical protein ARMGADRAFT_1031523 [Armillaria gallica]